MREDEQYQHLKELMGCLLAKRYVIAKIEHFESGEFIAARTQTKQYWKNVLMYFKFSAAY